MEPCFQFEHRVLRAIDSLSLLRRGGRALVAVSGGPDSTALLAVLEAISRRHGFALEIEVAHMNHCLRGAASDRDALVVTALARSLGLRVVLGESAGLTSGQANLEAEARRERFEFLHAVARDLGCEAICLGHTLDDQAETVLQRMARGAGAASLGGMRSRREDGVVRPLLGFRRADCAAYVRARGLVCVEDASNRDERFFRNRLRRRVLPALSAELGVDMARRLARLADELQVESALADARIEELLATSTSGALDVGALERSGVAAERLAHAWLVRQGLRPTSRQVVSLVALARAANPSGSIDLGSGRKAARRYGAIVLERAAEMKPPLERLAWEVPGAVELATGWRLVGEPLDSPCASPSRHTQETEWSLVLSVDAGRITSPLTVRPPQAGDRIQLRGGRRKLQDVFTDARIPRLERSSLVVVTTGADILWVPGVTASVIGTPGRETREFLVLRAEHVDCRSPEAVVKMQGFRVKFA